jgi:hypothetical protein
MSGQEQEKERKTGDRRIWEDKLAEARLALERGDVGGARKILRTIAKDSTDPESRQKAAELSRTLAVDPWFYVLWGLSAAVLLAVFIYYVVIK